MLNANFGINIGNAQKNYLNELNKDIDDAAELDSAFFWRKINRKRKGSTSEVEFKGQVCSDPQQIATGWQYSPMLRNGGIF